MATRGRKPGFTMSDEHRTKIANSQILKYLIEAGEGRRDMNSTQASIALGLLKKVMPDLQAVTVSGDPDAPLETISRVELVAPAIADDDSEG